MRRRDLRFIAVGLVVGFILAGITTEAQTPVRLMGRLSSGVDILLAATSAGALRVVGP